MKRSMALALAGVVFAALPVTAFAGAFAPTGGVQTAEQSAPPPIPMTVYGSASGVSAGQGVIAVVTSGAQQTTCGAGVVVADGSATVFVVDVVADGQKPGCGAPGRTVEFYFTPATAGANGKPATSSIQWESSFHSKDLAAGAELTLKTFSPQVAKDGSY